VVENAAPIGAWPWCGAEGTSAEFGDRWCRMARRSDEQLAGRAVPPPRRHTVSHGGPADPDRLGPSSSATAAQGTSAWLTRAAGQVAGGWARWRDHRGGADPTTAPGPRPSGSHPRRIRARQSPTRRRAHARHSVFWRIGAGAARILTTSAQDKRGVVLGRMRRCRSPTTPCPSSHLARPLLSAACQQPGRTTPHVTSRTTAPPTSWPAVMCSGVG
jgi:hypothetical protein